MDPEPLAHREPDAKDCPSPWRRTDLDRAAVGFNEAAGDRQPEALASGIRRFAVALKHERQRLRRDAAAGIRHFQLRGGERPRERDLDFAASTMIS